MVDTTGLDATSAYLFGRRTYEKMAAFWPFQPDDNPMAASLNSAPKYVATRTRPVLDWQESELLLGNLDDAVPQLKSKGSGNIVVLGSGDLIRQLMAVGLVDELRLFVHPLLLGTGKRLFGDLPTPRALHLESVATTSTGTVAVTYTLEARSPAAAGRRSSGNAPRGLT